MGPFGTFQPGMNPWLPQGFGQQPPGTRPGFPPPMPAGTTSAPPFGGMNPRIGPSGTFGGAVDSVTDQIMARLFGGGGGSAPGPSNMPQTPGPWGGPDPRMGPPPSFNRQGMPIMPGGPPPAPPGMLPPGLNTMPSDPRMVNVPTGGFGGADPRIGPMPQRPGMPPQAGPMPQVPPGGFGGPNARMIPPPQFDRQGNPIRPGEVPNIQQLPPGLTPEGPMGPTVNVPPGGFGGADPRMGPMPQMARPGEGGPMPQVPPGGFGGPNAAMSAAPQFNRQGMNVNQLPPGAPPSAPTPGPPGMSMQERMMAQYGVNPATGQPLDGPPQLAGGPGGNALRVTEPNAVVGARWGGVPSPTVGRGGRPLPAGPAAARAGGGGRGAGAGLPFLEGMDIDTELGDEANFITAAAAAEEAARAKRGKLPKDLLPHVSGDWQGYGEELDQKPPIKETALGAFMKGLSEGLPGALVAFAADRANSPELAQQYSQMKARELSELQSRREDEIRREGNAAEQARHLASLGMQKLTLRMDIEKNIQGLQQSLGTKDPAAFAKAVQAMMPLYATTGADPEMLRQNYPFLKMDVLNGWREKVKAMYLDTPDANLDDAVIENPFKDNERVSLRSAMAATYGIDANGNAVAPSANLPTREVSTRNAAGIEREETKTVRSLVNAPARVKHPVPSYQFMIGQPDTMGQYPIVRGSAQTGQIDVPQYLSGTPPKDTMTAKMDELRQMNPRLELLAAARDFLKSTDEFAGREPPDSAVSAVLQNPNVYPLIRQRIDAQKAAAPGLPNLPR